MTIASEAAAERPSRTGRPDLVSLANLVWAQVAGLVVLVVAALCGMAWWGALTLGIVVGLIHLLPLGKRTLSDWIATRGCFRVRRTHQPTDIIDFRAVEGRPLGLYRDGSRVVAVVEVLAPKGGLTRLGRATVHSTHLLPLPELAKSLTQHDILLSGIDIVSHGFRSRSGTPAGAVYESLLGPLPATAHRTVWLTIASVWPSPTVRRCGAVSRSCW
ncbi:type VII secretion protein EccE, partial [Nocardia sp. NPDC004582]